MVTNFNRFALTAGLTALLLLPLSAGATDLELLGMAFVKENNRGSCRKLGEAEEHSQDQDQAASVHKQLLFR